MATSPSHRPLTNNLGLPSNASGKQERKMSYRVPPPPAPLDIPEPVDIRRSSRRPPSPLRNSYTAEHDAEEMSEDGSDNEDDDGSVDRPWSQRSHSPSPSMAKFATNFAQRVGALVGSANSRSSAAGLPTEAEIEAEAEKERERSRREAEVIIKREAEERRMVEDGVFAMLESTSQVDPLPPPPARSQTMPSNSSSPSSSQKERESWFSAVRNKLTPTKEPMTPAQQIIQETKAKDKEKKKGKDKDREWPSTPGGKYSDPAFLNLASNVPPEPITPPRPLAQPSLMTPSPKRSVDSSRDAPPLYAEFNNQGTLDVPGTLLTIARRFEKLERWSVSHVRALEDRMGDVERWLVEKEKKELALPPSSNSEKSSFHSDDADPENRENDLGEIRDELVELQGRVGELGREMAKLMTAPLNLTSGPARNAVVSHSTPLVPPTPISIGPRSLPTVPVPVSTPRTTAPAPVRPKEASPPPSSHAASASVISTGSSRTRLPYPTGDYTSPPGAIPTKQDIISPSNSPPSSLTEASRKRPLSIAGLPSANGSFFQASQSSAGSGLPRRQESPPMRALSPNSAAASPASPHQSNISPTPRKRYTVALGAPITGSGAADPDEYDSRQRNVFSASPVSTPDITSGDLDSSDGYEEDDAEARAIGHSRDDTVGRSEIRLVNPPQMPNDTLRRTNSITSPRQSPGTPRIRAQSSYGPPSGYNSMLSSPSPGSSPTPITPLRPRLRSKSIDRIGLGISAPNANGRFVDPLVIRKQEKDALTPRTPNTPKFERGKGKVPIGELVAFFDKDKR
ncbi:hypothetical protein DFH11DRAFT_1511353 [Phellopilus nigrolimitatus]|nr:hypothetical protein DFH11DRAFT_1511353 [Phellopilus nigrolimitatus]